MRSNPLRSFGAVLVAAALPLGAGCGTVLGLGDFEDAPPDGSTSTSGSGGGATTTTTTTSSTSGTGGAGGSSGTGGAGGQLACEPAETVPCYEGAAGTEGKGACKAGLKTCLSDGSGFGECVGDVLPAGADDCTNNVDASCDGALSCACAPGAKVDCYDGPAGSDAHPPCQGGQRTCDAQGAGFGPCDGQIVPLGADDCDTPADENCDGIENDLCTCAPDEKRSCYGGPDGTVDVGNCKAGTETCNANGTAWGPCVGEVTPAAEKCDAAGDEDCNGVPCSDGIWSRIYTSVQKEDYPIPESIDVDGSGNVVFTGTLISDPLVLDNGTSLTASFLVDLDPDGNVLWSKQWGFNVQHVSAAAGAVDVCAVGEFTGTIDVDGTSLTSAGGSDLFIAAWTAAGTKKWAIRVGGAGDQHVGAITYQNGVLLVAGTFTGAFAFSGGSTLTAVSGEDAFVAKINPLSGAHVWSKAFGDVAGQSGNTQAITAVAVDAAGSAFIGGNFTTSVAVGANYLSAGGTDMFVAKLAGATGAVTWGHAYGGIAYDGLKGLAVDSAGAAVFTGHMGGALNFGGALLPFGGLHDVFAVKLDAAGNHVWSKSFGGTGVDDGEGIAIDTSDNVVLAGTYAANGISFGGATFTGADNYSTFLAKLDPQGNHLWSKGFDAVDLEFEARVAAVAGTNRLAYTFTNQGTVDLGNGPLVSPNTRDSVVVGLFNP